MSPIKPTLPEIPEADRTPLVDVLLELVKWQSDRIEQLEDEIQKLKQETRKPKFKSSKMDEQTDSSKDDKKQKKGPKRSKTQTLVIHDKRIIQPENIPENARFKLTFRTQK